MQDNYSVHDQPSVPSQPPAQKNRRVPVGIIAGLSAVVLAAGGGTAYWTWNSITNPGSEAPVPVAPATTQQPAQQETQPPAQAANPTAGEQAVQVYWVDVVDETQFDLVPVTVQLDQAEGEAEALTVAFDRLLDGPTTSADAFSEIPQGTELRDLYVDSEGVHVDLSEDFTTGGGSASMTGRLAQVLYTATSLESNASVWISVGGEPLEVLGGEGLIIDQPLTRSSFEQDFAL